MSRRSLGHTSRRAVSCPSPTTATDALKLARVKLRSGASAQQAPKRTGRNSGQCSTIRPVGLRQLLRQLLHMRAVDTAGAGALAAEGAGVAADATDEGADAALPDSAASPSHFLAAQLLHAHTVDIAVAGALATKVHGAVAPDEAQRTAVLKLLSPNANVLTRSR
eukprot:359585-Chlamydomonas_euryale.AAC.6